MSIKFPSGEWIQALSTALNESPSYEQSAKDWEGDFLFIVEEDENYPKQTYLYLGLHHGKSPEAMELENPKEKEAEYIIRAPYKAWRNLIESKADPFQAMMTRRLKLEGNMMRIMRYPKAAKEIMACTQTIPTEFEA